MAEKRKVDIFSNLGGIIEGLRRRRIVTEDLNPEDAAREFTQGLRGKEQREPGKKRKRVE